MSHDSRTEFPAEDQALLSHSLRRLVIDYVARWGSGNGRCKTLSPGIDRETETRDRELGLGRGD